MCPPLMEHNSRFAMHPPPRYCPAPMIHQLHRFTVECPDMYKLLQIPLKSILKTVQILVPIHQHFPAPNLNPSPLHQMLSILSSTPAIWEPAHHPPQRQG